MYVGLKVNCPLLCPVLTKLEYHKTPSSGSQVVWDRLTNKTRRSKQLLL